MWSVNFEFLPPVHYWVEYLTYYDARVAVAVFGCLQQSEGLLRCCFDGCLSAASYVAPMLRAGFVDRIEVRSSVRVGFYTFRFR